VKMRFRTDGSHYADLKTFGWTWEGDGERSYGKCFAPGPEYDEAKAGWDATPKAEPGDVWRLHWGGVAELGESGPVAGYAICCPGCGHVHPWIRAKNCNQKVQKSYVDSKTGQSVAYESCVHEGVSSCWQWSGSAEEGTLTASPSLQVQQDDCHWHGWIQAGDIHN